MPYYSAAVRYIQALSVSVWLCSLLNWHQMLSVAQNAKKPCVTAL